jgi:hypothetical protein
MFTSQQGDQWVCPNGTCGMEVVVAAPSLKSDGANLRCCCGGEMVRRYSAPAVRKLDPESAEAYLQDAEIAEELRATRAKRAKP